MAAPTMKIPSAFLPVALALANLSMLLGFIAWHVFSQVPIVREADEGPAAHLFQLMVAGQFLIMIFFALKWLPQAPKPALRILALQIGTALLPLGLVFYLGV
jgi:hypothetical protein